MLDAALWAHLELSGQASGLSGAVHPYSKQAIGELTAGQEQG